jgi:hypothetical protein
MIEGVFVPKIMEEEGNAISQGCQLEQRTMGDGLCSYGNKGFDPEIETLLNEKETRRRGTKTGAFMSK